MRFRILLFSLLFMGCCGLVDMQTICSNYPDPSLKDSCFSAMAMNNADSTACNQIQNATVKDYCFMRIAILQLNSSQCSQMSNDLRAQCGRVVEGVKLNDSRVCGEIKDNETVEICTMRLG